MQAVRLPVWYPSEAPARQGGIHAAGYKSHRQNLPESRSMPFSPALLAHPRSWNKSDGGFWSTLSNSPQSGANQGLSAMKNVKLPGSFGTKNLVFYHLAM